MPKKQFDLQTLSTNERNPRYIGEAEFQKLCNSIKRDPDFMELRPIVVDESNTVLGGNMRLRACLHMGMTSVPASWVVQASNLSEEQKKRFVLVDNGPKGMTGDWDYDILASDYELPDLEDLGISISDIGDPTEEEEEKYSRKIEPPIYEPKGKKPSLSELVDTSKSEALVEEIDKSKLPEDIKQFLSLAAQRHNVFNYSMIAEYYCHADETMKELMEKSALIIIDLGKAIENGFVSMTKSLVDLAGEDSK